MPAASSTATNRFASSKQNYGIQKSQYTAKKPVQRETQRPGAQPSKSRQSLAPSQHQQQQRRQTIAPSSAQNTSINQPAKEMTIVWNNGTLDELRSQIKMRRQMQDTSDVKVKVVKSKAGPAPSSGVKKQHKTTDFRQQSQQSRMSLSSSSSSSALRRQSTAPATSRQPLSRPLQSVPPARRATMAPNFAKLHQQEQKRIESFRQQQSKPATTSRLAPPPPKPAPAKSALKQSASLQKKPSAPMQPKPKPTAKFDSSVMVDDEIHFKADPNSLRTIMDQEGYSAQAQRPSYVPSSFDTSQSTRASMLLSRASMIPSSSQALSQSFVQQQDGRPSAVVPPVHPPQRFSFSKANSSFVAPSQEASVAPAPAPSIASSNALSFLASPNQFILPEDSACDVSFSRRQPRMVPVPSRMQPSSLSQLSERRESFLNSSILSNSGRSSSRLGNMASQEAFSKSLAEVIRTPSRQAASALDKLGVCPASTPRNRTPGVMAVAAGEQPHGQPNAKRQLDFDGFRPPTAPPAQVSLSGSTQVQPQPFVPFQFTPSVMTSQQTQIALDLSCISEIQRAPTPLRRQEVSFMAEPPTPGSLHYHDMTLSGFVAQSGQKVFFVPYQCDRPCNPLVNVLGNFNVNQQAQQQAPQQHMSMLDQTQEDCSDYLQPNEFARNILVGNPVQKDLFGMELLSPSRPYRQPTDAPMGFCSLSQTPGRTLAMSPIRCPTPKKPVARPLSHEDIQAFMNSGPAAQTAPKIYPELPYESD